MASLKEQAEYQRLALAMKLVSIEDVVAWADSILASLREPPIEIINVSLAGNRYADEVVDLLAQVQGLGDIEAAAHQVLAILGSKVQDGQITLESAVDRLLTYSNVAAVSEHEQMKASNFQGLLYCVQHDYCGTMEDIRDEIVGFAREVCHSQEQKTVLYYSMNTVRRAAQESP
jgi:hypothetical protein